MCKKIFLLCSFMIMVTGFCPLLSYDMEGVKNTLLSVITSPIAKTYAGSFTALTGYIWMTRFVNSYEYPHNDTVMMRIKRWVPMDILENALVLLAISSIPVFAAYCPVPYYSLERLDDAVYTTKLLLTFLGISASIALARGINSYYRSKQSNRRFFNDFSEASALGIIASYFVAAPGYILYKRFTGS